MDLYFRGMNTVQILTSQNVMIEMKLAGLPSRIMAFFIDQLIMVIFYLICYGAFSAFDPSRTSELFFVYLVIVPAYFFYSLFLETTNKGRTFGKQMMGIRVRSTDGSEIGFYEAAGRWIFRIPDLFLTAGTLAIILIGGSEKRQRLGDKMAGTMMVVDRKTVTPIDKLINNKKLTNYEVKYPYSTRLEEEDVVWIKKTLTRATKYPNTAHKEAIALLARKVSSLIEGPSTPSSPEEFLKRVIKDYVMLTR